MNAPRIGVAGLVLAGSLLLAACGGSPAPTPDRYYDAPNASTQCQPLTVSAQDAEAVYMARRTQGNADAWQAARVVAEDCLAALH